MSTEAAGAPAAGLTSAEKRALLKQLLDQQQRERERRVPLSEGQRRLWLLQQIAPESPAYLFPAALRVRSAYDVDVLRRSVQTLADRHPIFRVRFVAEGEEVTQRPHDDPRVPFDVVDAAGLDDDALRALVAEHAERPMDLAAGPVFRATLFARSDTDAVLLLVWHHIVLDGWSIALALEELGAIHAAHASGIPMTLPEAPPYRQFVEWQRRMLEGDEGAAHAAYWREALADAARLNLPTDRPRPAHRGYRGSGVYFTLGESLTTRVHALASALDTTPFVLLLAAWQALLHRMTGEASVPVSFPVNGRTSSRFHGTAGYFVNQVAVDGRFDRDLTWREHVAATRAKTLGALEHQDFPLSRLATSGDPAPPVSDVLFTLHKSQAYQLELPRGALREQAHLTRQAVAPHGSLGGLAVEGFALESTTARFDLELQMIEQGGAYIGWLQYDAELFEEASAREMSDGFLTLLAGMTTDVDTLVARTDALNADARRRLLVDWNATATAWPDEGDVAERFVHVAGRVPGAVAARCGAESITFRALDERSNRVAGWLRAAGAAPQEIVGLHAPRSIDMLVALLGIVKAGCVYLPLDPANPAERLRFMLQDSGARFVVASHAVCGGLPGTSARTLCMGCAAADIARHADVTPERGEAPLLYVVYTSGSSGEPKGVLGTQRGLLNRLQWQWAEHPFTDGETCAQLTTLAFVDAVSEIFGALLAGVPLAIVPDDDVRDVERLVDALATSRSTRVTLVPSLLRVLLDAPDAGRRLSTVRWWHCSGEAMDAPLARRFHERLSGARLLNLYGCSEAAADSVVFEVARDWRGDRVPIGRPIANTQVYLLDRDGQLVPRGGTGEIHIGGAGVAAGYLGRPTLNAERFIELPVADGARVYRTGDLARYRADGTLEYLGRADQQLKIRGNRVEPGEVEAALGAHPDVASAAVIGVAEASGDHALVAYVVPRTPGDALLPSTLRALLAHQLPSYMVPSRFVLLDDMPRTATGKVNRRALPAPVAAEPVQRYSAPSTETERQLAAVWQAVLDVPALGVDDDFFESGGHSILAVQAMSRASVHFGKQLPVALLFQFPTVRTFAAHLDGGAVDERRHHIVHVQPHGTRPPLFWIPGGVGMLAFTKIRPLVAALGDDQPLYGLATRPAKQLGEIETVPERARAYVGLIREAQPDGPYHIVGFCLGGAIAYEVAQQLRADGHEVAFLALVNAWVPALSIAPRYWLGMYSQRALYHLRVGVRGRKVPLHDYFMGRARVVRQILTRQHFARGERIIAEHARAEPGQAREMKHKTAFRATVHVASQYRPARYAGKVHVYVSPEPGVEGVSRRLDPRCAWRRFSDECEITPVNGGHWPKLDELGVRLGEALRVLHGAVNPPVPVR